MNLILLERGEVDAAGRAALRGAQAEHVLRVLKAQPGDTLRIGLIDGPRGEARVVASADGALALDCSFEPDTPGRPPVDLLLAVPRPKVLKRLWPQLAALGVGRVLLVNAARVERCYFDTHVIDPSFFRPLLLEGLQQARDTRLPEVSIHRRLRPFIEDELDALAGDAARLVAHPGGSGSVRDAVRAGAGGRVLLAVGPEGGWVPFELELLQAHGFAPVSLGARALRTDTACIALISLVRDALRG